MMSQNKILYYSTALIDSAMDIFKCAANVEYHEHTDIEGKLESIRVWSEYIKDELKKEKGNDVI